MSLATFQRKNGIRRFFLFQRLPACKAVVRWVAARFARVLAQGSSVSRRGRGSLLGLLARLLFDGLPPALPGCSPQESLASRTRRRAAAGGALSGCRPCLAPLRRTGCWLRTQRSLLRLVSTATWRNRIRPCPPPHPRRPVLQCLTAADVQKEARSLLGVSTWTPIANCVEYTNGEPGANRAVIDHDEIILTNKFIDSKLSRR